MQRRYDTINLGLRNSCGILIARLIENDGERTKEPSALPEEIVELQKGIRFIVSCMYNAIANHDFEKARSYSNEERRERDNLRVLRERNKLEEWEVELFDVGSGGNF